MANDDELAEMIGDSEAGKRHSPRLSEYTPEAARLDVLADRIGELISATYQAAGGKPLRVKPAQRPETAFARAQKRRTEQRISSLIAEVEDAQQRWSAQNN